MKITKKAFIDKMTTNNSYFIGVTKKAYSKDELYCKLADLLEDSSIILEERSCIARSRDLVFNTGSVLDLYSGSEFYCYEYAKSFVLSCVYKWHDDFDEKDCTKAMYYLIRK